MGLFLLINSISGETLHIESMKEGLKPTRLSKAAREFNVGISTIVEFLAKKGYEIDGKPNTKINAEYMGLLIQEYQAEKHVKEESQKIGIELSSHESISLDDQKETPADVEEEAPASEELLIKNVHSTYEPEAEEEAKTEAKVEEAEEEVQDGELKVLGKIDLASLNQKNKACSQK